MLQSATDKGELLVSLSYNNSLERLTIGVYEGRGFNTDLPCGRYLHIIVWLTWQLCCYLYSFYYSQ